jgi:cytochrome c oxidase subunit 4
MSDHDHADGHDFAHPMPVPMLLAVFFALVFLTIITVAQANFNFGSFDVVIVMVIATIKAALVAFFFMHLAFDKPFNVFLFFGSFVFVALFVIFTLGDARITSPDKIDVVDEVPAPALISPLR